MTLYIECRCIILFFLLTYIRVISMKEEMPFPSSSQARSAPLLPARLVCKLAHIHLHPILDRLELSMVWTFLRHVCKPKFKSNNEESRTAHIRALNICPSLSYSLIHTHLYILTYIYSLIPTHSSLPTQVPKAPSMKNPTYETPSLTLSRPT